MMTILRLKKYEEREGKHRNNNNNNNSIQNRQGGFAYMPVMWVEDLRVMRIAYSIHEAKNKESMYSANQITACS